MIAPLNCTAIDVLKHAQTLHWVDHDAVHAMHWLEMGLRDFVVWLGVDALLHIDTSIQTCARRSLENIAEAFRKIKEDLPGASETYLIGRSPFHQSLLDEQLRPELQTLAKACRRAHDTVLTLLSELFDYDPANLRPSYGQRWATALLHLRGEGGLTPDLDKAHSLFIRNDLPDEPGKEERIFAFLQAAAAEGHAVAQYQLALWHLEETGIAEYNTEFARALLAEAAKQNFEPARHKLAELDAAPASTPKMPPPSLDLVPLALTEEGEESGPVIVFRPPPLSLPSQSLVSRALARIHPPAPEPSSMEPARLESEAQGGNGGAHMELSRRYANGTGLEANREKTEEHLMHAVALGNPEALRVLCFKLRHDLYRASGAGAAASIDPPEQTPLDSYPEDERALAYLHAGHWFLNADSPHYDEDKAYACFHRASRLGHLGGVHAKGILYERQGRTKKALEKYKKAARGSRAGGAPLPEAQHAMGMHHLIKGEHAPARKYFTLAAAQEEFASMFQLSKMLKEGIGGPKDPEGAERLLLDIEKKYLDVAGGDVLVALGDLYREGSLIVERNASKAFNLYELARQRSSVLAYVRIGEIMTHRYTRTDNEKEKHSAFRFLKEAEQLERLNKVRKRGYLTGGDASYALAKGFEEGVVCPRSDQLALHFYLLAAREGNYEAWKRVIKIYDQGELGIKPLVPDESKRHKKAEKIYEVMHAFDREKRLNPKKLQQLFAHPGMTEGAMTY